MKDAIRYVVREPTKRADGSTFDFVVYVAEIEIENLSDKVELAKVRRRLKRKVANAMTPGRKLSEEVVRIEDRY